MSPRWIRRIAEMVLYGVFIFVDAHEIWPESHTLAVLLFIAATIALLLLQVPVKPAMISSACVVVAGIAFLLIVGRAVPKPHIGWLQPGSDPTTKCINPDSPDDANKVAVILGDTGFRTAKGTAIYPVVANVCQFLKLKITDNGLSLDANIFDINGAPIGTIRNNGFKIAGEDKFKFEETGDLTTVIVHDLKNNEILYVRWLNPKAIRVRGIFTCDKPEAVTVTVTNTEVKAPYVQTGQDVCVSGRAGIVVNTIKKMGAFGLAAYPPANTPEPYGLPPEQN